jgi:hypothetical protein
MMNDTVLYREVQRWRDVGWVMLLVLGVAALQWWAFLQQMFMGIPFGNNPAPDAMLLIFWLFFGIGLPLFFLWLHLVVEVRSEAVIVRYRPFINRAIPMNEIAHVEARVYRPMMEFGGWGIRGWGNRVAYNVSGNTGVELTLIDGRRILLGSRHAAELAGAIYKAWGGRR